MIQTKYLILGAGPSGLTLAAMLKQNGINDFIVLEKEEEAGGLCRSKLIDGSELDIGGGHFLDVRNKHVTDFLFQYMPEEEWNLYQRNSMIQIGDKLIDHPIEAHIWQFDVHEQIDYLKAIATAGCNLGVDKPEKFVDWIYWKLGKKIADDYMLPYNQKMFGNMLNELGTYWLEKLPNVSFDETIMSCLERKPYGKQPGHACFYYPKKFGYGEVWRRIGQYLGENVRYKEEVVELVPEERIVTTRGNSYCAEKIITTIPWSSFRIVKCAEAILTELKQLHHTSIIVDYVSDKIETDAHWIYYPDLNLPYHRVLMRCNFLENSRGYWTETNGSRCMGMTENAYVNTYAYPLNTIRKPIIMENVRAYFEEKRIYALGRWGEHQHYNSDVCVEKAMAFAEKFIFDR